MDEKDLTAMPQRVIKFRVWNGEDMISPDYIDRDGTPWWKENSIPTSTKNPLLQFTGLHDKNGKEIYEGDVLRHHPRQNETRMDEVAWSLKRGRFNLGQMAGMDDVYCRLSCEVIGNIWETPELMAEGHQDPPSPLTKE